MKREWKYRVREGRDSKWRGSARLFAVILYGRDQLMAMLVYYNVVADRYLVPDTYEYFYQDIVSVETNRRAFVLTSAGGTRIEVPMLLEEHDQPADVEGARSTVRNVRAMLRERKGAPGGEVA